MGWLYIASVWLHVVAATAWIGSMIFFAAVIVPAIRDPSAAAGAPALIRIVGARYRTFGWIAIATLLVTGVTNLVVRGIGLAQLARGDFWAIGFGRTLAWKLLFVLLVLVATGVHESAWVQADRRRASLLGRATLLLSLAVVFFAVELVRGAPS